MPRSATQPLDNDHKSKLIEDLDSWKDTLPELLKYHESHDPENIPFEALLLEAMYK